MTPQQKRRANLCTALERNPLATARAAFEAGFRAGWLAGEESEAVLDSLDRVDGAWRQWLDDVVGKAV